MQCFRFFDLTVKSVPKPVSKSMSHKVSRLTGNGTMARMASMTYGYARVSTGMRELIKDADIGKEMIALLVISCPLEILNVFWDSIKKDDKAETEIRLNDLCSKVQDACTLASSLQESQNRIEEKVHGIDERLSRRVDDKSGISFLKSNSAYELKITMCRHRR